MLLEHHHMTPNADAFDAVPTPDQTIIVVLRGEQTLESFKGGAWRKAVHCPGSIYMRQGEETDRLRWRPGRKPSQLVKANLYVPAIVFRDAAEHYRRAGSRARTVPLNSLAFHDPLIRETVAALLQAVADGAPDLYAQAAMQLLATHLLSAHATWLDIPQDRRSPGVLTDKRLAVVVEYMSERLGESLSINRLASEAGVSKFHFIRLFREAVGTTPHEFLVGLRMDAARRMLAISDQTVSEVATVCGFSGPAAFGAAFAKRFGETPTSYRARVRRGLWAGGA